MNARTDRQSSPAVSITIVAYNSEETLPVCLQSLRGAVARGLAEVVVVDNASPDGSARLVQEQFPEVQLLRSRVNHGFAGGCNLAWPTVGAPYWLLLNPDVVVPPLGVERLCEWMEAHPEVGAATPELVDRDGRSQDAARRFPSLWRTALELSRLHRLLPSRWRARALLGGHRASAGDELGADWVPAAALIVRRAVVEQVGLMRTDVLAYGEDIEWCWRMRRAGWRVGVHGGLRFVHDEGQSTLRTWGSDDRRRRIWSGTYWACERIHGRWHARALVALTAIALLLETYHPGRPPSQRERAWRDLVTHVDLLRGGRSARPGAGE